MKSFLLFIAMVGAIALSSSLTSPVASAARTAQKQRAVTTFYEPVILMGVTLQGEYLFVHDDDAMARGEACTYVYKGQSANPGKLVTSFHCTPAMRSKAAYFTVRTLLTSPGVYQLKEFQFAGSTEAHIVPLSPHTNHLTLTH